MTCSEPKCVALATVGGLCGPHAAGYRKHEASLELRCATCLGLIRRGEWYQVKDGRQRHVKACKAHVDATPAAGL